MDPFQVIQQPGGVPFQLPDATLRVLLSGARLEGVVVIQRDSRFVMVGNALKLPLPDNVPLNAGQRVVLELAGTPRGSQLKITPMADASPTLPSGIDKQGVLLSLSGSAAKPAGGSMETPGTSGKPLPVLPGAGRPDGGHAVIPTGSSNVSMATRAMSGDTEVSSAVRPALSPGMPLNPADMPVSRATYPEKGTATGALQVGGDRESTGETPIVQLARQVLGTLAADLVGDAERVVALLPPRVPLDHAVVKALITLFLARREFGNSTRELLTLLGEASRDGLELSPEAATLMALYAPEDSEEASSPDRVLTLLKNAPGGDLAEKVLASVVKGEVDMQDALSGLRATIRQLVAILRQQRTLTSWASETGRGHRLEKALTTALDHGDAAALQHLHGERLPYRFFDLSGSMIPGLHHALIHWMPDRNRGGGHRAPSEGARHTLELDLSFSALGDVWVGMTAREEGTERYCACRIRCAEGSTRELLARHSDQLRDGLRALGYERVQVSVEPWNGDRLAETARLLRALRPITLSG
ncbi:MAG TPA: flagellar hook-length control protein FliK [Candidatus Hydrogenedentes bacterium]|nr:flagellar hook-length control protein FliK [Candidatus Hydrogenedentota bacterium]